MSTVKEHLRSWDGKPVLGLFEDEERLIDLGKVFGFVPGIIRLDFENWDIVCLGDKRVKKPKKIHYLADILYEFRYSDNGVRKILEKYSDIIEESDKMGKGYCIETDFDTKKVSISIMDWEPDEENIELTDEYLSPYWLDPEQ